MRDSLIKITILLTLLISACSQPTRMGMVKDSKSGIQIGSVLEKSFFVDSSQFKNKRIKVTTRNVSGDNEYRLKGLENSIEQAFAEKGFIPVKDDSFGIKVDINVMYSGHVQTNMSQQFAFLGGAAGGIEGYRSDARAGTATGILVGATLGAIIGSFIKEDTYITVTQVSIGVTDSPDIDTDTKVIRFDSSPDLQKEKSRSNFKPFRDVGSTKIAVYAGGTNISEDRVSETVKSRLIEIVKDII
ncbi:complement resistance protein TraT [Methylophilus flavus]|uniref:Complement resistance protein TraT n=1 Tax=Methylophilus flavus TaxID=640084 RepID=A0ABW3PJI5_9PROT